MIDTHTHIYLPEFDTDRDAVVASAIKAGVGQCWLPAIDASSLEPMKRLSESYPGYFRLFAGLHPTEIGDDWQSQMDLLHSFLLTDECSGVGEIGMDLYWDTSMRELQKEVLTIQLDWAVEAGKPVLLHVRSAYDEILPIIRTYYNKGLYGIFHCFSGTIEQALELTEHGFLLGVNGSITYKNNLQRKFLHQIPLSCIVAETDAPYLPPVPNRGKRNEPSWILYVINCLSDIYGIPAAAVSEAVGDNAQKILQKIV